MDWLKQGLKRSKATFKLIANPVPMAWYPLPAFEAGLGNRWQGYSAQREELLGFILANDIPGVFWLPGASTPPAPGFSASPASPTRACASS